MSEDTEIDLVLIMEDKLQQTTDWSPSCNEVDESDTAISKLACQVEEQRQLRIQDAKFVEAKAARIKEWVTNKLRELEAQNQHLREQNLKCNHQLELLRRHMAQLSIKRPSEADTVAVAATEISSSPPLSLPSTHSIDSSTQSFSDTVPVYARIDCQSKKHASGINEVLTHRRYSSVSATTDSSILGSVDVADLFSSLPSQPHFAVDIHSLATLPVHARPQSVCIADSDLTHDYAEIYTPSGEKVVGSTSWECYGNGKPPTPPLHRFPSWESRIYRVANEGLSNLAPTDLEMSARLPHSASYTGSGYYDMSCPVYATVKGRASQIRASPFISDSSDDSSDGEDHHHGLHIANSPCITNSDIDNTAEPSFESGISDDYAIPPDAVSNSSESSDWSATLTATAVTAAITTVAPSPNHQKPTIHEFCIERCGNLAKLGGKLKTWRKRWFHLSSSGVLRYWKSQGDMKRKPRGEIVIDELCAVTKSEGGTTFEISTPKKTFYLTADSTSMTDEWIRALQGVQNKNSIKLSFDRDHHKPTIEGWLTKVRNGHAKKCWCVLVGKTFLYFKSPTESQQPSGQINMKEAKVEQVEHVSDSDSDEKENAQSERFTIGIFPSSQPPTYLLTSSKQEMDSWLYHLTVVSGGNPNIGTQYEQLIQKLMETDGDPNNVLWKHPLLSFTKETISTNLTSLCSEALVTEAIKLFKSCQLFMSVAVESTGIDYHVVLAQNALQLCLDNWQLQAEFMCILIKQTSPHTTHKMGVPVLSKLRHRQILLCTSQSLFACDSAGSPTVASVPPLSPSTATTSETCKSNPPTFVFLQGWQLIALAVSLFVPKDHRILWYLKCHVARNTDIKTECGKYAAYCKRALQRTIQCGNREIKPSRMEVLSILLKNPYHHSLPHSIPVHFLNGSYQVVGFDGSTSIQEFLKTLTQDTGCRESTISGFALFSDDPIEKDLEHYIDPKLKLCDVISKWETALREKGSGKFENTRVIRLVYKNRLYFKLSAKNETDREKLFACYQTNRQITNGYFPLTKELALELAALMAQIDLGEFPGNKSCGSDGVTSLTDNSKDLTILQAIDKFYPYRYRNNLSTDALRELQNALQEKWMSLKGRSSLDCIRIYLTCTRKWPYFGASLFQAKWKQGEHMNLAASVVWLAVSEDNISLLELGSMQPIAFYSYSQVLTFGGCQEDFMLVINSDDGLGSHKLLFSMSKPKILELTLIIADYMNALGRSGTVGQNNIQRNTAKSTPSHQLNKSDSKKYHFDL